MRRPIGRLAVPGFRTPRDEIYFGHTTLGNCFCARRTVDGRHADRRRGVRGSDPRGRFRGGGCGRGEFHAPQASFLRMLIRSALPSVFWQRVLMGADPWAKSRTRMQPSSRGTSTDWRDSVRWSKRSKSCAASLSGIVPRCFQWILLPQRRRAGVLLFHSEFSLIPPVLCVSAFAGLAVASHPLQPRESVFLTFTHWK